MHDAVWAIIRRHEDAIRNAERETALVFDAEGSLILSRAGTVDRVWFTDIELTRLPGAILTHNHPSGEGFSEHDIHFMVEHGLAEMRAVTSEYRYSVRRPARGWDLAEFLGTILPLYQATRRHVRIERLERLRSGRITEEEANQHVQHVIWSHVFKQLHVRYAREDI
jgi:hypothetical protein